MTRSSAGRVLLFAGGIVVALGSFFPEIETLARNLIRSGPAEPMPDRSHWFVFREALDMLLDPDLSLQAAYYVYYGAQALALAYLVGIGAGLAVSVAFERCRAAAIALYGFHAAFLFGLGASGLYLSIAGPGGGDQPQALYRAVLMLAIALFAALAFETALAVRVFWGRPPRRLLPVDAVNVLPAALICAVGAGLFLRLRGSANWPAGGYLAISIGALLALAGMALRCERASGDALSGAMLGSDPRRAPRGGSP